MPSKANRFHFEQPFFHQSGLTFVLLYLHGIVNILKHIVSFIMSRPAINDLISHHSNVSLCINFATTGIVFCTNNIYLSANLSTEVPTADITIVDTLQAFFTEFLVQSSTLLQL